jgi:hypothetical protein
MPPMKFIWEYEGTLASAKERLAVAGLVIE